MTENNSVLKDIPKRILNAVIFCEKTFIKIRKKPIKIAQSPFKKGVYMI